MSPPSTGTPRPETPPEDVLEKYKRELSTLPPYEDASEARAALQELSIPGSIIFNYILSLEQTDKPDTMSCLTSWIRLAHVIMPGPERLALIDLIIQEHSIPHGGAVQIVRSFDAMEKHEHGTIASLCLSVNDKLVVTVIRRYLRTIGITVTTI